MPRAIWKGAQDLFDADFLGTFAPFSRASLKAMAIACLRLLTFCPDPLFNVPRLRRRIADSTLLVAALPYLAILHLEGW